MLTKRSLKNITIMRKVYTPSLYYIISTVYLLCINTVVNWSANTCPQLSMLQTPSHTWPDTVPPTTRTSPRPLRSNSLCAAFMGVIGGWSPLSLPFAGVWSCRLDKMCCTVRPWVARSHELRFCCLFDETSHTYSPTGDWKSKVFLFDAAIMQTGWVKSAKMCINLAKKKLAKVTIA